MSEIPIHMQSYIKYLSNLHWNEMNALINCRSNVNEMINQLLCMCSIQDKVLCIGIY